MYQNMQPPRKLFVIFCQVRQFCLFRHQVGQFCFNLPSPAICLFRLVRQFRLFRQVPQFCWPATLFISPSQAILFCQDQQIHLICWVWYFHVLFHCVRQFCLSAKNSSSCKRTWYQKKQNIQLLTQFISQKPLQPRNWLRNYPCILCCTLKLLVLRTPMKLKKQKMSRTL